MQKEHVIPLSINDTRPLHIKNNARSSWHNVTSIKCNKPSRVCLKAKWWISVNMTLQQWLHSAHLLLTFFLIAVQQDCWPECVVLSTVSRAQESGHHWVRLFSGHWSCSWGLTLLQHHTSKFPKVFTNTWYWIFTDVLCVIFTSIEWQSPISSLFSATLLSKENCFWVFQHN